MAGARRMSCLALWPMEHPQDAAVPRHSARCGGAWGRSWSGLRRNKSRRKRAPARAVRLPKAASPTPETPLTKRTRQPTRWKVLGVLALLAMVLASYLPAMLWGGFVWDDVAHIPGEPALRDLAGLQRIWFAPTECAKKKLSVGQELLQNTSEIRRTVC